MARRGRGIDFQLRFNTSRWAEDLLLREFARHKFLAARIGLSHVGLSGPAEIRAGESGIKIPDLLVFRPDTLSAAERALLEDTDLSETLSADFATSGRFSRLAPKALAAIEVEFSPYRAAEMGGRLWTKKTAEQLRARPRRTANPPVAPNIWIKDQDLGPLLAWEERVGVPIVVVHVFDLEAFSVPLSHVAGIRSLIQSAPETLINTQLTSGIFFKRQRYDRTDAQGAAEEKDVYVVSPAASLRVGTVSNVSVKSQIELSASKKYVAHVLFSGGQIDFDEAFIQSLFELARPSPPLRSNLR